jgi:tetratricopeptide (TPR) repeat protein
MAAKFAGPYRFFALRRAARLSALRRRPLPQIAATPGETRLELWSKRLTTLTAILLNLLGYGTVLAIVFFLAKDFGHGTISIAPITVPKTLADDGYTPDVAAQRLKSALNKVVAKTRSLALIGDARSKNIEPVMNLQAELPNITVPGTGISLETISTYIRAFFHSGNRWDVSGEITGEQNNFRLRLRINGQDRFVSEQGVGLDRLDSQFLLAAPKVYEVVDPYIFAASLAQSEPDKSLEIAQLIVATTPKKDVDAIAAHVLIGSIFFKRGQKDEAVAEFWKAIELDPRSADIRVDLGRALQGKGELEKAIEQFRWAKTMDRNAVPARISLGTALQAQGQIDMAAEEFHNVIAIDPHSAPAYVGLGAALRAQGKAGE